MSAIAKAPGVSPEVRAGLFQFSVFLGTGVTSVYFAIWLAERGISPEQTGIINALPVLLALAINVLIGRLADRASDWRTMVIILALIAGVVPIGLFFVNDFWGILIVFSAATLPAGALVPVVDAATLRMTQRRGTDFGAVRAWATIGYMVATAGTGLVIAWFGSAAFVPAFVFVALLRAGLGFLLPRFRAARGETVAPPKVALAGRLREVLKPWFLLPLSAFALIQSTHIVHGAFASLVWRDQGIGADTIGWLIALGALAEALMMFAWRRVGPHFSARMMIAVAGAALAVRWSVMALAPSVPVLVLLQCMHAISYPFSYFGVMQFVANWTSEDIAAEAQGLAAAVAQGASALALVGFGWIAGYVGGGAYFAAAAATALAVGFIALSLWLKPAHS